MLFIHSTIHKSETHIPAKIPRKKIAVNGAFMALYMQIIQHNLFKSAAYGSLTIKCHLLQSLENVHYFSNFIAADNDDGDWIKFSIKKYL